MVVGVATEEETMVGEVIPIKTVVIREEAMETTTDLFLIKAFRMEAKTTAFQIQETKATLIGEEEPTIKVETREATQTSGEINKITVVVITTTTEEAFRMQVQRIHIIREVDFNNQGLVSNIDQVVPRIFPTNGKVVGTTTRVNQCRHHRNRAINRNQDSQISPIAIQTTAIREATISKIKTTSLAKISKEEVFKVKTIPEAATKETLEIIFREAPHHLSNLLRLLSNRQRTTTSHLQQIISKEGIATLGEEISRTPARTTRILGANRNRDHQAHKTTSSTKILRTTT